MGEANLAAALRYVSPKPLRARLIARAQDWTWSSTRASQDNDNYGGVPRAPAKDIFPDAAALLTTVSEDEDQLFDKLRGAESIGRPLGGERFVTCIDASGRFLHRLEPRYRSSLQGVPDRFADDGNPRGLPHVERRDSENTFSGDETSRQHFDQSLVQNCGVAEKAGQGRDAATERAQAGAVWSETIMCGRMSISFARPPVRNLQRVRAA